MAKVTLAPFIKSISGKVGNLEFRTLRSGRTVVHARNVLDDDSDRPKRVPSAEELLRRKRFGVVARVTAQIQNEYKRLDEAALARRKIWNMVSRHYEKAVQSMPHASSEELCKVVLRTVHKKLLHRSGVGLDHDKTPSKSYELCNE